MTIYNHLTKIANFATINAPREEIQHMVDMIGAEIVEETATECTINFYNCTNNDIFSFIADVERRGYELTPEY